MKKTRSITPKSGALRVWHIPQVPGKPFHVEVKDTQEALKVLGVLAHYDLFQFRHNIKPDYANAQGLEVFEDGEWIEWQDENGSEIREAAP